MATPDRTFAALVLLSGTLIGAVVWSAHHLVIAGAPTLATGGPWPGLACLVLPLGGDVVPHAASAVFLLAIASGALDARIAAILDGPVALGGGWDVPRLIASGAVVLLAALPLVAAPLPLEGVITSSHNVVDGCHLA